MKTLLIIAAILLIAGCTTMKEVARDFDPSTPAYTCVDQTRDSCARAVTQGYQTRFVTGNMWPSAHVPRDKQRHMECQVLVGGEWCYIDNKTGEPLVGWYGKLMEPGMTIDRIH